VKATERQVVALGGGGFSMEPDNRLLDEFVLSLVPKKTPKICFLPTASADSAAYIVKFYRAFSGRAIPTDLTIFDPPSLPRQPADTSQIASFLAEQDIIYVGGGNTANLLAIWRAHGLDRALADAWARGTILSGISAGMICWFRDGLTDSFGQLRPLGDGLGFIETSACPHYDEGQRRPAYHEAIAQGLMGGYAADDGAALHFRGTKFVEVVSSRPAAAGYRVELVDGRVQETRIEARYLGASDDASRA
jgi:dipeptidase E